MFNFFSQFRKRAPNANKALGPVLGFTGLWQNVNFSFYFLYNNLVLNLQKTNQSKANNTSDKNRIVYYGMFYTKMLGAIFCRYQ